MTIKSKTKFPLFRTDGDFFSAVDEVAQLAICLDKLKAHEAAEIQKVRDRHKEDMLTRNSQIKGLLIQCEAYAEAHRPRLLLAGKKSSETAQAFFGWRQSSKLKVMAKKTWDDVLATIKERNWMGYIRTKEEVNKDAIRADFTPEQIAAAGCYLETTDDFYIEPKDKTQTAEQAA